MNLKIIGLTSLLSIGFARAYDFEDDWIEFVRNKRAQQEALTKNTPSKSNGKKAKSSSPLCTPPSKNEKEILIKLDYKELYDNFEKYQDLETLDGFIVDREALLKEALEEIALLEEQENEQYANVIKYGAATLACFMVLCAPFVPIAPLSNISDDIKAAMIGLGFAGSTVLSAGTVTKAYEYMHYEQPLKARHVAIKNWLNKVH